ncbi:MAG: glucose-6-phosphate isomerase, partial [Myxococcota bacterium]
VPESVTDVIVLGIGGSSLGMRAIAHALGGPPELRLRQQGDRAVYLADNSDPWLLSRLLETLTPQKTLVVTISKSGSTVETVAQWLVVRRWLETALGRRAREHQVFITDPERGVLQEFAVAESIPFFAIPPNVGGRFSVLSAVGLLPSILCNFDAKGMMQGAKELADACRTEELSQNPAGMLAALHVLHQRLRGHNQHVLMPYADALRPFGDWWVQLWAESLGKRLDRRGRWIECGPTPISAIGATDQHAQGQLFMEGPRNKLITFIEVSSAEKDLTLPKTAGPLSYLSGTSLTEILKAELQGSAVALANDGRPSLTLRVARLDARHLGALFFLFEAATAIAGEMMGINPFDQPGVEAGKRLTAGLLGRPGYEEEGKTARKAMDGDKRYYAL